MDVPKRVRIAGTHRDLWPGSSHAAPLHAEDDITLTAWFRSANDASLQDDAVRRMAQTPVTQRVYADRVALARETDADDADRANFAAYCSAAGIRVRESHWRSAIISGPLERLIQTFGATAATYRDGNGHTFRQRTGSLYARAAVATSLRGVFGLEQWPRSPRLGALTRHATPLRGSEVASRYGFPPGDGSGETIAILQFRGEMRADDYARCMEAQGIDAQRPIVKRIDGAAVAHEIATTKDLEAALDAQLIAALAPRARLVIYEAPDDERGFLDAIRSAIFDPEYRPSILSISYGWPESLWTPGALEVMNDLFAAAALCGISVFCSSGDNGAETQYDGKAHVLAPASSPHVHACGATCIVRETTGEVEVPWERAGGGESCRFTAPPWQSGGMRAVPDVAAQQQPGYCVYLEAMELAIGGTSAVAPVWAALTARLNQRMGKPVGLWTPVLYRLHKANHTAQWNPRSGLGVPNGSALERALREPAV